MRTLETTQSETNEIIYNQPTSIGDVFPIPQTIVKVGRTQLVTLNQEIVTSAHILQAFDLAINSANPNCYKGRQILEALTKAVGKHEILPTIAQNLTPEALATLYINADSFSEDVAKAAETASQFNAPVEFANDEREITYVDVCPRAKLADKPTIKYIKEHGRTRIIEYYEVIPSPKIVTENTIVSENNVLTLNPEEARQFATGYAEAMVWELNAGATLKGQGNIHAGNILHQSAVEKGLVLSGVLPIPSITKIEEAISRGAAIENKTILPAQNPYSGAHLNRNIVSV